MENYVQPSFIQDLGQEQNVNMMLVKRKKRKQLEVNIDGALVELNLLLLPLAPVGREKEDVGSLIVKWTDSKDVLRGIKVSMTEGYSMLTNFDIKVLTALLKIYSEENAIIPFDFENKRYDMPIEINYTIAEISRKLGYKSYGGTIAKKLQNSIRKLANVTITSMFEGGIYDIQTKSYIKSSGEKGFHIIEEYDMYRYSDIREGEKRLKNSQIKDCNKVVINKFFYNSMCNGYCKIIPFDQLVGLKHEITQRIFSLLEGWFCNKKPFVYFKYKTLYSRIPMDESQPVKNKNRDIKVAAEELVGIGYIKKYIIKKGEGIYFIFDDSLNDIDFDDFHVSYYGLDKYNSLDDIVNALVSYGIGENDIDLYVKESNIDYIKALLRYFDIAMRYDRIEKNPTEYLLKGLKIPYNIDKKYYNEKKVNVI